MASLGDIGQMTGWTGLGYGARSWFSLLQQPVPVSIDSGTGTLAAQLPGFVIYMFDAHNVFIDFTRSDPSTGEWIFYTNPNDGVYWCRTVTTGEGWQVVISGAVATITRVNSATLAIASPF